MSEFVKPRRVEVDVSQTVKHLFGEKQVLIKDLHENEAICSICNGTGIKIERNSYGLSEDPDRNVHFPYTHQSISFCPNCYNGIVRFCPDCGKQYPRGYLQCDCAAVKRRKLAAEEKKEAEDLAAATKHDASALGTRFVMCFSPFFTTNEGFFSDWDEFFEDWHEWHENDSRPEYVWGTDAVGMSFDAYDIVSTECENMYEDAFDDIGSKAISDMQTYFNKWVEENGLTTYYMSSKHAVKIPWDKY